MRIHEKSKDEIKQTRVAPVNPNIQIMQVSTVAYLIMGTIGALVALYGHKSFYSIVAVPPRDEWWHLASITLLTTCILLIGGYLFEGWFSSYRAIKRSILDLLGPTSWYTAIYLAIVSSVGEELLFRAALQPFAGLLITSLIFGLVHIGPEGGLSAWTLWAFCAGLLIGWMFETTGSIWPSMGAHFLINSFSLLRIQREYRRIHTVAPKRTE